MIVGTRVRSWAPGRVNLIGDHTDYNGGLALPMAIDLGISVEFAPLDGRYFVISSSIGSTVATISLDGSVVAPRHPPHWAGLAAAVISLVRPERGGDVGVTSSLPRSAGLSSSAAFCVALALALGSDADPFALAELCRLAEARVGAHVGLMDPLVSAAGRPMHALLVDFSTIEWRVVPLPAHAQWVVIHSGMERDLADSAYGERRAECESVASSLGKPLGTATGQELEAIKDPTLRARARHVVTECQRTREFANALEAGDLSAAGNLMSQSHASMAGDFDASTRVVDALVESLCAHPGVFGARMTGGGFGGCVVAVTSPGALDLDQFSDGAWLVTPAGSAEVETVSESH